MDTKYAAILDLKTFKLKTRAANSLSPDMANCKVAVLQRKRSAAGDPLTELFCGEMPLLLSPNCSPIKQAPSRSLMADVNITSAELCNLEKAIGLRPRIPWRQTTSTPVSFQKSPDSETESVSASQCAQRQLVMI